MRDTRRSTVQQRKNHSIEPSVYRNVDTLVELTQALQMPLCIFAAGSIDFV